MRHWVFGTLILGLLVYEGITLLNSTTGDTISEIVWTLSKRPFVPFVLGFLMGHFFWQQSN